VVLRRGLRELQELAQEVAVRVAPQEVRPAWVRRVLREVVPPAPARQELAAQQRAVTGWEPEPVLVREEWRRALELPER
jgi:hypothetical protein